MKTTARLALRKPLQATVEFRDPQTKNKFVREAINLSANGILVRCDAEWETGRHFELRFTLPDAVTVQVLAEVCRVQSKPRGPGRRRVIPENAIALKFLDLSREDLLTIQKFIRS